MGKVINTTNQLTPYTLVQTPKNLVKDNYFIDNLQEKIWADWEYRPNRVDIEQEKGIGQEQYFPLEVVIQNIKNDKGEKVSDDYKRIVFQDVKYQVRLGTRFRFSFDFDLQQPDIDKNIWLATNKDSTVPTASVVLTRCNGTLGSIVIDAQGKSKYHYEPCVSTTKLTSVNFHYANEIIVPQSQIILLVQHNKYTRDYYINQRFILGYDTVYKVKGMDKFNSLHTYQPEDVDIIVLYAEVDEKAAEDDFEHRIAFNKANVPPVQSEEVVEGNTTFKITTPDILPTDLYSTPILFEAGLYNGDNLLDVPISVQTELSGTNTPEDYFELVVESENSFTLRRRKIYTRSNLRVNVFISKEDAPDNKEVGVAFELSLKRRE